MRLITVRTATIREPKSSTVATSPLSIGNTEYPCNSTKLVSSFSTSHAVEHRAKTVKARTGSLKTPYKQSLEAASEGAAVQKTGSNKSPTTMHPYSTSRCYNSPKRALIDYGAPIIISIESCSSKALSSYFSTKLAPYTYESTLSTTNYVTTRNVLHYHVATSNTVPVPCPMAMKGELIVHPVMNADCNLYVLTLDSLSVISRSMHVLLNVHPLQVNDEKSFRTVEWMSDIPMMYNVAIHAVAHPIFCINEEYSYTYGRATPTIGSSSSIAGKFSLKQEYLDFYNKIKEDGFLITVGAILDSTPKVTQLYRAVRRYTALGYSYYPPVVYHNIEATFDWFVNPELFTIAGAKAKVLETPKFLFFRAPPVITDKGTVVIYRAPPLNTNLMICHATNRLLIYYSMFLSHGYRAEMFVKNLPTLTTLIEQGLNAGLTQMRVAAHEIIDGLIGYEALHAIGEKPEILKIRLKRDFVKVLLPELRKSEHAVIKIGYRAINLSEFLDTATKYAITLYKSFCAASLMAVMFGAFSRRYAESTFTYYKKAFKIAEEIDKVLGEIRSPYKGVFERLLQKQAEKVREISEIDEKLAKGMDATVRTVALLNALQGHLFSMKIYELSGPIDPTPAGFLKIATSILENTISMGLGMNLALYEALSTAAGDNPLLRRLINKWFSRYGSIMYMDIENEVTSLFSNVLEMLAPKDLKRALEQTRASEYYKLYFKTFTPVFIMLHSFGVGLPEIAQLMYYAALKMKPVIEKGLYYSTMREKLGAMSALGRLQNVFFRYLGRSKERLMETVQEEKQTELSKIPTYPCCGSLPPDYLKNDSLWAWFGKYIKKNGGD